MLIVMKRGTKVNAKNDPPVSRNNNLSHIFAFIKLKNIPMAGLLNITISINTDSCVTENVSPKAE
jgi:hypothetical protein